MLKTSIITNEILSPRNLILIRIKLNMIDKTDHDSMASKREAVAKAERAFKLFDKEFAIFLCELIFFYYVIYPSLNMILI